MVYPNMKMRYVVEQTVKGYRVAKVPQKCRIYLIRYGNRKIAEVWTTGNIRKFYRNGKREKGYALPAPVESVARWTVSYLVLRDAFDEKTALDWHREISLLPDGYLMTANTKAELFSSLLEAQQRKGSSTVRVKA